jgi:hypothetical protein
MWFALSDADGADRWRKTVETKLSRQEPERSRKLEEEWRAVY